MVCLRNICINTLHKGDDDDDDHHHHHDGGDDDDDDDDDNNNNNNKVRSTLLFCGLRGYRISPYLHTVYQNWMHPYSENTSPLSSSGHFTSSACVIHTWNVPASHQLILSHYVYLTFSPGQAHFPSFYQSPAVLAITAQQKIKNWERDGEAEYQNKWDIKKKERKKERKKSNRKEGMGSRPLSDDTVFVTSKCAFQSMTNKMQRYTVLYFCKLLYMFRVDTPPIIRSTKL